MPDCQDGNIQWGGQSLNSVAGISAKDVWAVGSSCYSFDAIIEHWNGTAWSMVAGASPAKDGGGATASLYGVAAISPSNVWAVGYSGSGGLQTMIEHWNGSSWQVSSGGGVSGYLSSVSATGPNDVWASGGTNNGNLIEHWDGAAWTVVQTPQPANSSLDSVTALSPTDAWAVGSKRGSNGGEVTFTLHWNGTSWSEVASPNPSTAASASNQLRSVVALASNDVWALGMYENEQTNFHQHRTLALHWDGSSWSLVDSPTPGRTGQLTTAAAVPSGVTPGQLFAGGYFSYYDRNIYDGHYTDPRTLVLRG
jgi:hypothetical protein